jgi:hypothetical protein
MENVTNAPTNKEGPVAAPNHTERIKSQVLAKIGKLPRLGRVEVSRHHGGHYPAGQGLLHFPISTLQ